MRCRVDGCVVLGVIVKVVVGCEVDVEVVVLVDCVGELEDVGEVGMGDMIVGDGTGCGKKMGEGEGFGLNVSMEVEGVCKGNMCSWKVTYLLTKILFVSLDNRR
ncbi:hypothetical protein Tco_0911554 [Tanacetum coccineum]|uniref:Uncharacterized protein n=1 Tax=Tanacetum coccineum TaxID=301880 RepID=A0ABQ5CWZ6_9ASTR